MSGKKSIIGLAALAAAPAFGQTKGPSSSATPYVLPVPGYQAISLLTAGDSVNNKPDGITPYRMVGLPDGLGAYDNNNGTFTVLMHHEVGNTLGVTRAHGAAGAFVSEWVIDKSTLQVLSGQDLMQNVYNWNGGTQQSNATTSTIAFNRFCSADLPATTAFYNATSGLGTQTKIFMGGEESGSAGYAMAHVASGADKGKSYVLGKFNLTTNGSGLTGVGGWENLLANPFAQNKTVVVGTNDGGTGIMGNAVSVYVGTKTGAGTEADKAGLTNGTTKFVNVTGQTAEITNTTTRATGITSGSAFTLGGTSSTTFSRPEDGAWDPSNPSKFYFVTTDRLDTVNDGLGSQVGRSRLWRLNFSDITNPDAGGTIDMILDGTEGGNMFDNMTITGTGKVVLQEDVGGAAHNGKIYVHDLSGAAHNLTLLGSHDVSRFGDIATAATAPFTNDEESSGIIDVSSIFGKEAYLAVDQAHYSLGGELVEGGQLILVTVPEPTGVALLGLAGGALSLRRRRR